MNDVNKIQNLKQWRHKKQSKHVGIKVNSNTQQTKKKAKERGGSSQFSFFLILGC